jgi:hypothetical protein
MKLETVERMAADAESLRGRITFFSGRNTVAAVYDRQTGNVTYRVNDWPCPAEEAARILDILQSGLPVSLPG